MCWGFGTFKVDNWCTVDGSKFQPWNWWDSQWSPHCQRTDCRCLYQVNSTFYHVHEAEALPSAIASTKNEWEKQGDYNMKRWFKKKHTVFFYRFVQFLVEPTEIFCGHRICSLFFIHRKTRRSHIPLNFIWTQLLEWFIHSEQSTRWLFSMLFRGFI